jgi:GNAT superfamily N-acetyltransferase
MSTGCHNSLVQAGSDVLVRPADHDDIASLVDAYTWLFDPPADVPVSWDPTVASERLRRVVDVDSSTAFVALLSGELVGFCTVYLDLESVRFGQRAWVNDMAVNPLRRSGGIGHLLLQSAFAWARGNGASVIQLDSGLARLDAHRFYRREQPTFEATCFGWRL